MRISLLGNGGVDVVEPGTEYNHNVCLGLHCWFALFMNFFIVNFFIVWIENVLQAIFKMMDVWGCSDSIDTAFSVGWCGYQSKRWSHLMLGWRRCPRGVRLGVCPQHGVKPISLESALHTRMETVFYTLCDYT